MALLSYVNVSKTGFELDAQLTAASAGGDQFEAANGVFFAFANGDASSKTVTIAAPVATTNCGEYGSLTVSNLSYVVPAGETWIFTVPTGYQSAGKFSLTYSAVTSCKVGGFALA